MRPTLLILDFDGTFTDVDEEAAPFLEVYREGLAELLGRPIDEEWAASRAEVERDPDSHGFEFDGKIVAPSHADPYILATSVARRVFARLEVPELASELEGLFRRAYGASRTVFRPDAREVLEALLSMDMVLRVLSNSYTASVVAKLERLMPAALDRVEVTGDARKFHLVPPEPRDPRFDAVPETLDVPGLERPIYLRRGRYYERLRAIWASCGAAPERTLVCGDIFELDLALPAALGARVHLVGRGRTPAWERDAALAAGGAYSTQLRGLLETL